MTALHGLRATNTLTLTSNSLAGTGASVTVEVASNTFLATNNVTLSFAGNTLTSRVDYQVGASSSATATTLAAKIRHITGFTAAAVGSTVTITCSSVGSANNGKGIASSAATRLVLSASTFTGGVNNVSFVINHSTFTQGVQWNVGVSSSVTGSSIVTAVNSYSPISNLIRASSATATPGVVTLTVISSGTLGNTYTLTSSSSALMAAGSARFTGGVNNGLINFNLAGANSVVLTEGTDWQAVTSSQATIGSIATAITGNSTLNALISVSTATGAVSTLTSKGVGLNTNYGVFSSSTAGLSVSNRRMVGGAATSVVTASNKITATAHTLTTGLAVLFAKTAGTAPGLLVTGTTYYAIRVDANSFKLASSTTNAVAGTAVSVATQTSTGGGSFTVTPSSYIAKANTGFKWQASNDNATWNDLSVSSVTYSSPSTTASSIFWDFGTVNYRYVRLKVISPTQGGLYLVVPVIGRSN